MLGVGPRLLERNIRLGSESRPPQAHLALETPVPGGGYVRGGGGGWEGPG